MTRRCPRCGEEPYGLCVVHTDTSDDAYVTTCLTCGFVIGIDYPTRAEAEAALEAMPEAPSYAELASDYADLCQEYAGVVGVLREIRDLAQSVPEGEGKWVWTGDGLGLRIDEALDGKETAVSGEAPF